MAGEIVIGTRLNSLGFEQGIRYLERLAKKAGSRIADIFNSSMSLGKGILSVVTSIVMTLGEMVTTFALVAPLLTLLALGGIAVSEAFKQVNGENQQIITDLKYMVFAIKQALEPVINSIANVIRYVINLLVKAMQVVAVIIKMITGKNIFAGATLDKFKESMASGEKSSKKTAKNLKEAKNQLAGFDEMNVLTDTSSNANGVGADTGTGIGMPDFDLSNIADMEKTITEFIDKLKANIKDAGEMIKLSNNEWIDAFGKWGVAIKGVVQIFYGLWEIIDGFANFIIGIGKVIVGIITGDTNLIKEGIIQMLDGIWKMIDGLFNVIKGIINVIAGLIAGLIVTIIEIAGKLWNGIKEVINKIFNAIQTFVNSGVSAFNTFVNGVYNKFVGLRDKIKDVINKLKSWLTDHFGTFGTKVGEVIGAGLKNAINKVLSWIETQLNKPIRALNSMISEVNKMPGVSISKISTFKLPRLAKGGIINMPGKGIPVGSAIGGERGAEGVIPLTDSQQMALLGEAIGKYITVNANITNTMNGRVISRELQKIQSEDDFAFNR